MRESVEPKLNEEIVKALQDTSGQWTPRCLRPDDLMELIEQGDRARIARHAQSHLATCAYCRNERRRMEAVLQQAAQARALYQAETQSSSARSPAPFATPAWSRWRRGLVPVLATACMFLTIALVWQRIILSRESTSKEEYASLSRQLEEKRRELEDKNQQIAKINDTVNSITKQLNQAQNNSDRLKNQNVALAEQLKQKERQLASAHKLGKIGIGTTVPQGPLDVNQEYELPNPDQSRELGVSTGGTASGGSKRSLILLRPAPKSTLTTARPTFKWKPVEKATHYQLTLWKALRPAETQTIERLTTAEWTPTRPLTRGAVYEWGVTAVLPNGEEEASRPSRFLILKPRTP